MIEPDHRELARHVARTLEATNRFIFRAAMLAKGASPDSPMADLIKGTEYHSMLAAVAAFNRWADEQAKHMGLAEVGAR